MELAKHVREEELENTTRVSNVQGFWEQVHTAHAVQTKDVRGPRQEASIQACSGAPATGAFLDVKNLPRRLESSDDLTQEGQIIQNIKRPKPSNRKS